MDNVFEIHNLQLESIDAFRVGDPQLRRLNQQALAHRDQLLDQLPTTLAGIYALTGGRQIGKSTLIKQWMLELMESGIDPSAIYYLTGEYIDDHHQLLRIINQLLAKMPNNQLRFLIIDEVTYIKDWDKCIKFLADAGSVENVILMLTGSDTMMLQTAIKRFPGRRGKAATVNFHLYPLSFKETVRLKNKIDLTNPDIDLLFDEFNQYLIHGGFLTAINDFVRDGKINDATLTTYAEWIRGDMLRAGKHERYLQEIFAAIIKRYTSQLTWHSLADDLSIDHHQTVADYVERLASMDAVFILRALMEDKLVAAPKKARKLLLTDPFIYHAINSWVNPVANSYEHQIKVTLADPQKAGALVEACVATHIRCLYPTYYIKAAGEVDVAYIKDKHFWPIEVKWTSQIRPKDLTQIRKYNNGVIYSKAKQSGRILDVQMIPLPLALLAFDY